MCLFPAKDPLQYVAVYRFGLLLKTKFYNRFILVMAYRFMKRTQVVPLKLITCIDVAKAFASHWVLYYGVSKDAFSDYGPQFAINLYQNTRYIVCIANTFT